jgi:hypothetical protein
MNERAPSERGQAKGRDRGQGQDYGRGQGRERDGAAGW